MSQSSIGSAALILTTNAAGMRPGLDKAGTEARSWASNTAGAINSKLAAAGKLTGVSAGGGIVDGLRSVGPSVLAAAGGIFTFNAAADKLQDLARMGAASDAFGLTAEQFTGMAGVAKSVGEDTREFIESLVTLGKVASEGAAGKGEVATQFFADLKINAQDFAKLRLDEQFYRVFDALQKVESPGARVRALMTAFGEDGGKYLLPLLAKTPAELRKMGAGFAVTSNEIRIATAASRALTEAGNALNQLWRRIVIAAAPCFEFLANELSRIISLYPLMGDSAAAAIGKVIRVTAQLADATKAASGVALYAAGLRLKYIQAEIVARSTLKGIEMGGFAGGAAGLAGGLAVSALLEKSAIGPALREAGSMLTDVGKTLLNDVGKTTAKAEEFIRDLEARKKAPDAKGAARGGGPSPAATAGAATAAAAAIKADYKALNPLVAGTSAEVSARLKNEFGPKQAEDRMLEEQRKGNAYLKDLVGGVKAVAERISPIVELIPI